MSKRLGPVQPDRQNHYDDNDNDDSDYFDSRTAGPSPLL